MSHVNIEIKARTSDPERLRSLLENEGARHVGRDRQIDTYFRAPNGRMKLREGQIEHALIHYDRSNEVGPKRSDVTLYHPEPGSSMKPLLEKALGVDVVVEKTRDIYFIENVKFHVDEVQGLGAFVEIEAIDLDGTLGVERLRDQCQTYLKKLGVMPDALVPESYSDLVRSRR